MQFAPNTVMSEAGRGASSSGAPMFSKKFPQSSSVRLLDVVLKQRRPAEHWCVQRGSPTLNVQGRPDETGSSFP